MEMRQVRLPRRWMLPRMVGLRRVGEWVRPL
jgi:hypothetical protein